MLETAESTARPTLDIPQTMKAMPNEGYGNRNWKPVTVPVPDLAPDRFLIQVHAASINAADMHEVRTGVLLKVLGRLLNGLKKPVPPPAPGTDAAGIVVAVGSDASGFSVGDEVFGGVRGSLAEYGAAKYLALKPGRLTWEQAAAIPIAGVTALQGLRDKGHLQPGQNVLINGASGGVGTFAVQIAKALGGDVTGVCSTANVELVRSLGADHVVDYTKEDFAKQGIKYDVILDVVGNRTLRTLRRATKKDGIVVLCGAGHHNGYGGSMLLPLLRIGRGILMGRIGKPRITMFVAQFNNDDLAALSAMVEERKVTPVIDRTFDLDDTEAAFKRLQPGHAPAKVAIII